ncbi:MAG: hypothetical protein ABIO70_07350 [Pseudomonadota bacterium]
MAGWTGTAAPTRCPARRLGILSSLTALRGLTLFDRDRVEAALALAHHAGRELA